MAYVDNILDPGEELLFRTSSHWIVFVWPVVIAVFSLFLWFRFWTNGSPLANVFLTTLAIGAAWSIARYVTERAEECAVTNRRIIYKWGIIRREVLIYPMKRIQSIDVRQSVIGRLLNYGTVIVHTAAESHKTIGRTCIRDPGEWRKKVCRAIDGSTPGDSSQGDKDRSEPEVPESGSEGQPDQEDPGSP